MEAWWEGFVEKPVGRVVDRMVDHIAAVMPVIWFVNEVCVAIEIVVVIFKAGIVYVVLRAYWQL